MCTFSTNLCYKHILRQWNSFSIFFIIFRWNIQGKIKITMFEIFQINFNTIYTFLNVVYKLCILVYIIQFQLLSKNYHKYDTNDILLPNCFMTRTPFIHFSQLQDSFVSVSNPNCYKQYLHTNSLSRLPFPQSPTFLKGAIMLSPLYQGNLSESFVFRIQYQQTFRSKK